MRALCYKARMTSPSAPLAARQRSPRVFVSYSQDSPVYAAQVLALTQRLRLDGVDAWIDQFEQQPPSEGWPAWCARRITDADFVLLVCTAAFRARFVDLAAFLKGRGRKSAPAFEHRILRYPETRAGFVPVLFPPASEADIPETVRGAFSYTIRAVARTDSGYARLLRVITGGRALMPLDRPSPPADRSSGGSRSIPTREVWSASPQIVESVDQVRVHREAERHLRPHPLPGRRRRLVALAAFALLALVTAGAVTEFFVAKHRGHRTLADAWRRLRGNLTLSEGWRQIRGQATLTDALRQLPEAVSWSNRMVQKEDKALRFARAYTALETKLNFPKGTLAREVPALAGRLLANSDTTAIERARAFFARGQFSEAEKSASQAREQAGSGAGNAVHESIAALLLAGFSASEQAQYDRALNHFEAAEALTDKAREPVTWAQVRGDIGNVLQLESRYREAADLWREVVKVEQDALGAEHPETLASRARLAQALDGEGQSAAAGEEDREVLAIRQRVLGATHRDTLGSRLNLCIALYGQGNLTGAEADLRALRAVEDSIFSEDDPDVIMTQLSLANVVVSEGKFADGEAMYRASVAVLSRVLGPEHPMTLSVRVNLAAALSAQGKADEAEKEERELLAIRERVLGPDHPATLGTRIILANSLDHQGKTAEAEGVFRTAAIDAHRVFGPEHPTTVKLRLSLARVLMAEHHPDEAEQLYRAILPVAENVLGATHPDLLTARANFADALNENKKSAEAEKEYRDVVAARTRILGAGNPDTLISRIKLAHTLSAEGKDREAAQEIQSALPGVEQAFGPNNSTTLKCHLFLAMSLADTNNAMAALEHAIIAERGLTKTLGPHDESTRSAATLRELLEKASTAK